MSANFFALDSVHIQPTCYYWVEYYLANIKLDMFNMHDYFKFWTSGQRPTLARPGPARPGTPGAPPRHAAGAHWCPSQAWNAHNTAL